MGAAKRWLSKEFVAAVKAYVVATHDEVAGVQQKCFDFGKRVHVPLRDGSPPGCVGTGYYWDRDPDGLHSIIWCYIWDAMMKERAKFNGFYNKVINMNLTGVTEQEKSVLMLRISRKR